MLNSGEARRRASSFFCFSSCMWCLLEKPTLFMSIFGVQPTTIDPLKVDQVWFLDPLTNGSVRAV